MISAPALLLCALLGAAPPDSSPPPPTIRRFALIVGVNDGGPDRVPLRYARSDAERMAQVLGRLGGVAAADTVLLLDADGGALRAAFRDVEARVRAASATHRAELLVYFSGHADEQGLVLGSTLVPYDEVRRWLDTSGAQVRIAIVDSCSSGAMTRRKGGQRAPPFLVDTSSTVKGHAILTSSAADEASQESDRIAASFFTHFLLTGLRGAADANQDGKVTVNEAYQYAFAETLARTEKTRSGAQHPAYDIQLAGSGDVVVTDLRGTDATILFPEAAAGRFFLRDRDGRLVAELRKVAGRPVELGVEPGVYRLVREEGGSLVEAQVTVGRGARVAIPLTGLTKVEGEVAALRGGTIDYVPVDFSVAPPLSLNGNRNTMNDLEIGLLAARTTRLHGVGLAPVIWAEEDVDGAQLGAIWASAGGPVRGAQLSGVAGLAGAVSGVQLAGVGASASGEVRGAQLTGVVGFAGSVDGVQAAGVLATSSGAVGWAQLAGVAGFAESIRGVQLTGVLGAVARDVDGLQAAGVANYAGGKVWGAQLSGVLNLAGDVEGVQVSTVNVGSELRGLQLGMVNVATGSVTRGWQIGLVNVARTMDGIPLGLVNVVRDGWHRFLFLTDEDGTPTLAYGGGGATFHTTLEASLRRTEGTTRGWVSFGPGLHLGDGVRVDLDLLARREIADSDPYVVVAFRALVDVPVASGVGLVAGPTLNVLFARDGVAPRAGGTFGTLGGRGDASRAWVGIQAGLRL
jgi:hypothetical protein